jgi:hypothetical protein
MIWVRPGWIATTETYRMGQMSNPAIPFGRITLSAKVCRR